MTRFELRAEAYNSSMDVDEPEACTGSSLYVDVGLSDEDFEEDQPDCNSTQVPPAFEATRSRLLALKPAPGSSSKEFMIVRRLACRVMARLVVAELVPERVLGGSDNDIAFYFFGPQLVLGGAHQRYARLGCSVGGATVTLEDRVSGMAEVVEVSTGRKALDKAISDIKKFLT